MLGTLGGVGVFILIPLIGSSQIPSFEDMTDAFMKRNMAKVHVLINERPELATAVGPFGVYGLHLCSAWGTPELIDEFIKLGADVNQWDVARGHTPLYFAVRQGRLDNVKKLISLNAVVDAANHNGETPLLGSLRTGHLEIARELLRAGANPRHEVRCTSHYPATDCGDVFDEAGRMGEAGEPYQQLMEEELARRRLLRNGGRGRTVKAAPKQV
jgi:hypothetical protein